MPALIARSATTRRAPSRRSPGAVLSGQGSAVADDEVGSGSAFPSLIAEKMFLIARWGGGQGWVSRASSSATTESSSLRKIGVGWATGVPGTIGDGAQSGTVPPGPRE